MSIAQTINASDNIQSKANGQCTLASNRPITIPLPTNKQPHSTQVTVSGTAASRQANGSGVFAQDSKIQIPVSIPAPLSLQHAPLQSYSQAMVTSRDHGVASNNVISGNQHLHQVAPQIQVQNGNLTANKVDQKSLSSTIVINNSAQAITNASNAVNTESFSKRPYSQAFPDQSTASKGKILIKQAQSSEGTKLQDNHTGKQSTKIVLNLQRFANQRNQIESECAQDQSSPEEDSDSSNDSDDEVSVSSGAPGRSQVQINLRRSASSKSEAGEENTPNSDQESLSANSSPNQAVDSNKISVVTLPATAQANSGIKIIIQNSAAPSQPQESLVPSTQVQIGEEPEDEGNPNEIIDERAQKRMKLSSENEKTEQSLVEEEKQPEPPAQVYTSARESMMQHILQKASMNAFQYNAGLRKERKMYKRMFMTSSKMSAQDRNQLSHHQSNFLTCTYQGGQSFFEGMNNIGPAGMRQHGSSRYAGQADSKHVNEKRAHLSNQHDNQTVSMEESNFEDFQRPQVVGDNLKQNQSRKVTKQPNQQADPTQSMSYRAFQHFGAQLLSQKSRQGQEVSQSASGRSENSLNRSDYDHQQLSHSDRFQGSMVEGQNMQKQLQSQFQAGELPSSEDGAFRCRTCGRGPPVTKKYAKNQCQTCYKKDKKIQKEEDFHQSNPGFNQGIGMGYPMQSQFGGITSSEMPYQVNSSGMSRSHNYLQGSKPHMQMQPGYGGQSSTMLPLQQPLRNGQHQGHRMSGEMRHNSKSGYNQMQKSTHLFNSDHGRHNNPYHQGSAFQYGYDQLDRRHGDAQSGRREMPGANAHSWQNLKNLLKVDPLSYLQGAQTTSTRSERSQIRVHS